MRTPDRMMAIGLLSQIEEAARATASDITRRRTQVALRRAERIERDATAVREELEDLIREGA